MAVVLTGCSTVRQGEEVSWKDLLTPPVDEEIVTYDLQRLETDRQFLEDLVVEADALELDLLKVRRIVRFRAQPYLTQEENEAVTEGVKYSSLDYLLDTHINRLLVLRPRIDAPERQAQLAETVARLGVPYDFKFDFSDTSHLCCTELVYRVLEGKGSFDLSFSRAGGQWVLTADDLATAALAEADPPFDVVLLAENDPDRTDHVARLLQSEAALARLRELYGTP